MDHFNYQDKDLFAEDLLLADIADQHGTPCYVYSRATFERHWRAFDNALGDHSHTICYSVKANSNIAILALLAKLGSGFDVVSVGELERVLRAGGDPLKVVFSGVGKQKHELLRALEVGIKCFNVESESELHALQEIAASISKTAPVALRINPDVDPNTHPYIATGLKESKFGIDIELAHDLFQKAKNMPNIDVCGVDCHIGSQITELNPFLEALKHCLALIDNLKEQGIDIKHLNLGGGLGVPYRDETPPHPDEYAAAIRDALSDHPVHIILEPGRAIAANAGVLITQVIYLKNTGDNHFAIVDAAMNDLLRPALYQSWQRVVPLKKHDENLSQYHIVGPICESGDFLAKSRKLAIKAGDYLAIRSAGAYGFTMSSNYNSRPRAPEILVDGNIGHVIRERETILDLFELESIPTLQQGN